MKMESFRRQKFTERITELSVKKASNHQLFTTEKYDFIVQALQRILETGPTEVRDYSLQRKYGILDLQGNFYIFRKGTQLRYITIDEIFDEISAAHVRTGHGGRNIIEKDLSKRFANISREQIMQFIQLCEECQRKKTKVRKSLVVKPIVSKELNSRCQIDLIDMQSQPDGDFKFILVCQDHLTKFVRLRALKNKRAIEVAEHVLDIFCDQGAPYILQSDNGREFANAVIKSVTEMWPECSIVHGKPRHSQSQGSVEQANRDIQDKLACWLRDNKTSQWSKGLRFVQFQKNASFHSGIGQTPYEAMYSCAPRIGLASSSLPKHVIDQLQTEEQLQELYGDSSKGSDGGGATSDKTEMHDTDHGVDDNNMESDNDPGSPEPESSGNCIICQMPMSKAHYCQVCTRPCHAIQPCSIRPADVEEGFGKVVVCLHCHKRRLAERARIDAKEHQQKQAEKMQLKSAQRFEPAVVGQTVMVPLDDVDRGRADHRNVKAIVLEIVDGCFYRIGTLQGKLKQLYTRNQFIPCKESFISISEVPQDKEISLREVARCESIGTGQGFFRCNCTTKCQTKRCKCVSEGVKCNSKCHSSLSCCNK